MQTTWYSKICSTMCVHYTVVTPSFPCPSALLPTFSIISSAAALTSPLNQAALLPFFASVNLKKLKGSQFQSVLNNRVQQLTLCSLDNDFTACHFLPVLVTIPVIDSFGTTDTLNLPTSCHLKPPPPGIWLEVVSYSALLLKPFLSRASSVQTDTLYTSTSQIWGKIPCWSSYFLKVMLILNSLLLSANPPNQCRCVGWMIHPSGCCQTPWLTTPPFLSSTPVLKTLLFQNSCGATASASLVPAVSTCSLVQSLVFCTLGQNRLY